MSQSETVQPLALTIAGLDPSGGAGVIADARTFTAVGCSPAAVITSITFQNDKGVFGAEHLSPETIQRQLMAVVEGGAVAGVKTGMLPTRAAVREVVRFIRDANLPAPVVDPVFRSTSGYALIEEDAIEELLKELLPLARLVTPNIPEAERITGLRIRDEEGMRQAAEIIRARGTRAVLIKGGHLRDQEAGGRRQAQGKRKKEKGKSKGGRQEAEGRTQAEAIDVLDNDGRVTVFRGEWIPNVKLRGTGCMLSAAVAANLAQGKSLEESVGEAKKFVAGALRASIRRMNANQ